MTTASITKPAAGMIVSVVAPRARLCASQAVRAMPPSAKAESARQLPVLPRMAGAPAQEEIDETTGKGLRPRDDIANLQFELLVQCSRAG